MNLITRLGIHARETRTTKSHRFSRIVKLTMFTVIYTDAGVKTLADGGIELVIQDEDEFGNESKLTIQITRDDWEKILQMKNQGLI